MKREIKFRGKAINGDWVEGAYFAMRHDDERKHTHHFIIPDGTPIPKDKPIGDIQVEVREFTVGQFTGLHDKNGKEIYEGDILRGDEYPYHDDGEDNYLGVVFFADDDYAWEVMKFVTAQSKRSGISNFINDEFYGIDFSQMEVVGNLWDNKGLFRDSDEDIMKWFNG